MLNTVIAAVLAAGLGLMAVVVLFVGAKHIGEGYNSDAMKSSMTALFVVAVVLILSSGAVFVAKSLDSLQIPH